MSRARLAGTVILGLSTGFLGACDESTGNEGTIAVTITPAALTITQGTTNSANIVIARSGGFNGAVTLAVSGLPTGIFGTPVPNQLSSSANNAVVEISAALFSVPGTYTITISASGSSTLRGTASLQLTVMPAPDFRVSVSNTSPSVTAGASVSTNVNLDRTNFVGPIDFALLSAPAGVTATFVPAPATGNSSTLTINVAPDVTPASYPLVVQGLAAGIGSRTANLQLDVQPQPGAFTITATPGSFILPRGNSAVINIAIGRTDYAGPITLAFENPSPGVTGTITPATATGSSATFNLSVAESVPAGIYQLRIRASAPGFIDRVAFISVTVTVPAGGDVEYLYCDPATAPVFFAYQDGVGAWKALAPATTGALTRYAFTLVQSRGGVLAVTRTDNAPATDVYHTSVTFASTAELIQHGVENCQRSQAKKAVFANVSGVSAGEVAFVSLGTASSLFHGSTSNNPVPISGVPAGLVDLLAARLVPGNAPNRLFVSRGLLVPDGGTVPATVDFANPPSLTPAFANATLTGAGADLMSLSVSLATANGLGQLWYDLSANTSATRQWGGLANTDMLPGDFHGITATATPTSGATGDGRVAGRYVGAVSDQALAFGPVLNLPAVQQATAGSYPRYRMTGSLQSEYDKGVSIDIRPRTAQGNSYRIETSRAWLASFGNAQAYDVTMADVATLAGFPVLSRLGAGPHDAVVTGFGFTGQGIFAARPASGVEFRMASRGVLIAVP